MFTNILVPLDGSDVARRALAPALTLAQAGGGAVRLIRTPIMAHIVAATSFGYAVLYPDQSVDYSEKQSLEYLEKMQKSLADEGKRVKIEVRRGDPAGAIVEAAADHENDLIVMSSHGYSGVTRWLLGSVAEKVLRLAPCPVLVVRSAAPLRHMLIPLDGSALAEQALEPALALAAGLDLQVTLLRAVPMVQRGEMDRLNEFESGFGQRVEEEMVQAAYEYLAGVAKTHGWLGLRLDWVVRFEPAANSILEYAETKGVDLIAMATHGRGGMSRWVYGSVTEKVLRGAGHSMLVVRPPSIRPSEAAVGTAGANHPLILAALAPYPAP